MRESTAVVYPLAYLGILFENLFQVNACSANYRSVILIFLLFLQKPDGEREDLGEFLYQYLNRRFGVENMIIEWGYNLYDACGRYTHDPRVGLFYGILQKEVLNNDDFSLRTYFPWYNHSL